MSDGCGGGARAHASRVAWVAAGVLLAGWTLELRLPEPIHPLPNGAPGWIAHGADGRVEGDPVPLVVFLHGWNGCARAIVHGGPVRCRRGERPQPGWDLASAHAAAGTDTVLVVPQLAWRARDGSPGRLREASFARAYFERVRDALADPLGREPSLGPITLVAHSAGYETALALLALPQVQHVVLLDALYAGHPRFATWLAGEGHRRLVSMHIGRGKPHRHTRQLTRQVQRDMGADAAATVKARPGWESLIGRHRLTVVHSHHGHGALPRRHLAEVVRGLHGSPHGR